MSQQTTFMKNWLNTAAVLAAMVVASASAEAQYRVSNSHPLDANNRVGSGGRNDESETRQNTVNGNQIVTGNVTGGRQFRGPVGYSDPNVIRANTGFERSDRFVRDSSGAQRGPTILQRPTVFYGNDLAQQLPASTFRPLPGATGAVVGSDAPIPGEESNFGVIRPGASGIYGSQFQALPGGTGNDSLTASPLFGVRPFQPFQPPADFGANSPSFDTGDRLRNSPDDLRQMRDELNGVAQKQRQQDADQADATANDATPGSPAPLNAPLGAQVAQPGSALNNKSLDSSVAPAAVGTSGMGTGQGAANRFVVPPAQQSQQYKELMRRMQSRTGETDAAQDSRDFNLLRNAQAQGKKPQPGQPADAKQPGQPGAPVAAPAPRTPAGGAGLPQLPPASGDGSGLKAPAADPGPATPVEPLEIKSLATGVEAKGLASLLTDAEQLMHDQKYESAVGKYDQAGRVAPNNPMITLGRANALLGAGNYGQAEMSLRRAIGAEPALLLGRYDLNGFYGETRVKFLVKDLKEVAAASPKEVRPNLLLAYIAYNTGDGPDAAKYLDAAEKAAGQNDRVIAAMRKTWAVLGDGAATPPANPADGNK